MKNVFVKKGTYVEEIGKDMAKLTFVKKSTFNFNGHKTEVRLYKNGIGSTIDCISDEKIEPNFTVFFLGSFAVDNNCESLAKHIKYALNSRWDDFCTEVADIAINLASYDSPRYPVTTEFDVEI